MTNTTSTGIGSRELHERAQSWSEARRLRKVQEECAEAIAAIGRYLDSPTEERAESVATELEGVRITLENIKPEWSERCRSVRASQLQRFRAALERDGL